MSLAGYADSTAVTHWTRQVVYGNRVLWIDSDQDCPHPPDALGVVCEETGDDRVLCHLCTGIEAR